MNKIINIVMASSIGFSISANAIEDLVIHTAHQPEIIPFDFVVDAGMSAKKYVQSPIYQKAFIDAYSSALKEILIYKINASDFKEDEADCESAKNENQKALTCSRVAASEAVFNKKIPLDIESFGFIKKTIIGKIEKTSDAHSVLVLKTKLGDKWECILDEKEKYSENVLYTVEGFVSVEGAYGARGEMLEREFVVTKLTPLRK